MTRRRTTREVVVGIPSDDDLALPRPPGVFRRFWARHPRLLDGLVVGVVLLASAPYLTVRGPIAVSPAAGQVVAATILMVLGVGALWFRRRFPLVVLGVCALPAVLLPPVLTPVSHVMLGFAVYAVAVYRSTRACWRAAAGVYVAIVLAAGAAGVWAGSDLNAVLNAMVGPAITMLIGALLGVNVGERRRYLHALIERSRQLAVERDQQAQLASAAERARIAREMHDIVAHSLTVVVALSEGAAATDSLDRAHLAGRTAAETARSALQEMRAMLGVLRDDTVSPLTPLEPVDPVAVVTAAQRAGFPATLEMSGDTAVAPRAVRFALGRVVQEAVTNAMRHAPAATFTRVRVRAADAAIRVCVDNDGAALPTGEGGFGLRGLHERLEHVGGTLTAGAPAPGRWRVTAVLPSAPADPFLTKENA